MNTPAIDRILSVLNEKGPLSVADIARFAFLGTSTLSGGGYIRRMRDAGQIHIGGWQKNSNGFSTPLYKAGEGVDLPRPKFRDMDRDSIGMAKIVSALRQYGPMTYRQLALATGLSHNTIKNGRYMDALLTQKRVHVTEWHRNTSGPMSAIYADGRGRNAPSPAPMSRAEINRRLRERQRVRHQSLNLIGQLMAA